MAQDTERGVREVLLEQGPDGAYEAYTQEAFLHFLDIERRRAERAGRSVVLLLVQMAEGAASRAIPMAVASSVFKGMAACVREIDFIGWYRTGTVAGAVLVQGAQAPMPDRLDAIEARVGAVLREHLPSSIRQQFDVRAVPMRLMTES